MNSFYYSLCWGPAVGPRITGCFRIPRNCFMHLFGGEKLDNKKNNKNKKGGNNAKAKKPEKKEVTMDDAMARLLARFGK